MVLAKEVILSYFNEVSLIGTIFLNDFSLKSEGSVITITNMHGANCLQKHITAQKNIIEVQGLDNGAYHLNMKQGESNYNRLIIIQR